jgi:hypothetical protein
MSQLALEHGADGGEPLVCRLTPRHGIDVQRGAGEDGAPVPAQAARRILAAFAAGRGAGVLHLAVAELATELPPPFAYWREVGKAFVARLCGALDPTAPKSLVVPAADPDEIQSLIETAPPMRGAEFLDPAVLGAIWADMGVALRAAAEEHKDGVAGFLRQHSAVWHVVGRVCFHVAENRRDPECPFAFMATYVHRVSRQAKPQHLPLGRALVDYAGARNRQKLLALMAPLARAAERASSSETSWTAATSIIRCAGRPPRRIAFSPRWHSTSRPGWLCACPTGGTRGTGHGPRSRWRWATRRPRPWG